MEQASQSGQNDHRGRSAAASSFFRIGAAAGAVIVLAALIRTVSAATFNPPVAQPPEGNIPVTVWNRVDATEQQTAASIDIDGGGPAEVPAGAETGNPVGVSVGSVGLDLGATHPGQNLFYGFAPYANMNAGDRLLLLQTSDAGVWTTRFSVNGDGDVWARGCFGPMVQGITSRAYNGHLDYPDDPDMTDMGYFDANAICEAKFMDGGHVCSTAEILNSVKCGTPVISGGALEGVDAWIQDGPPGFTAPANDCQGWQSGANNHLGRMWRFDPANGGQGFLTTCNQTIVFACCR